MVFLLCLLVFGFGEARASNETIKRFDLPKGRAIETLRQAALQGEIQILFSDAVVEGVVTKAISGDYIPREALELMLEDTGLGIAQANTNGAYAITRAKSKAGAVPSNDTTTTTPSNSETDTGPEMNTKKDNHWFKTLAAALTLGIVGTPATTPAQEAEETEVFDLSPFVIDANEDSGYSARNTLAGTRLKTSLEDVAASVQVVTREFLEDVAADNVNELLIYTTNSETGGILGNFSGIGGGNGNTAEPRRNPQGAQRIRGLGRADTTRDYFISDIPFDSYNTNRMDINRGSNSILFGLGSPAGIINADLVDAEYRDFGKLLVRFGERGSHRASFDLNKQLFEDKLAVRVAAVYEDLEYEQRPTFEKIDRMYAAVSWNPFENTRIRAHYEEGDIRANRPDPIGPAENISSWLLAGKPVVDLRRALGTHPSGGTGIFLDLDGDGTVEEAPANIVDANRRNVIIQDASGRYFNEGNFFLDGSGLVNGPNFPVPTGADRAPLINNARFSFHTGTVWDDLNSKDPSFGFQGQIPSRYRAPGDAIDFDGQVEQRQFWSVRNLNTAFNNYSQQGFTSLSQFDFSKNLLVGNTAFQMEDFDNKNIALEQTFLDQKLGFEIAYDDQGYMREGFEPMQAGAANKVWVDMNVVLPDGRENPNYGRPFITNRGGKQTIWTERDTIRATGYYEFNFEDAFDSKLGEILGRHILTGLVSERKQELGFVNSFMRVNDHQLTRSLSAADNLRSFRNTFFPIMYVGDSLLNIDSLENLPLTRLQEARIWQPGTTIPVTFWDPGVQPGTEATAATDDDTILSDGELVSKNVRLEEFNTVAGLTETIIDSYAAIMQSHFLNENLVTTIGYRKDEVEVRETPGSIRDSFGSVILSRLSEPDPAVFFLENEAWNYGGVYHLPTEWLPLPSGSRLSLHYAESSNFQPAAGRITFDNVTLGPPSGETEEMGISFSTADRRFSARLNWYETSLKNSSISPSFALHTNLIFQSATFMFQDALDATDPQMAALNRATAFALLDGVLPGENERQRPEVLFNENGDPTEVVLDPIDNAQDTQDTVAEGVELELTFNPLQNWRIAVNIAQQETVRSNIMPFTEQFLIPNRTQIFSQPIPGFEWLSVDEVVRHGTTAENAVFDADNQIYQIIDPGAAINRTTNELFEDELIGFRTIKAGEGARASEQREWRFNLLTNYTFVDGPFKGIGIGGAVRWQDEASIGFPLITNADGQTVGDVANPYFDDPQTNIDLWAKYEVPLFEDLFDWTLQLNVRNVFADDDEVIPTRAQPDGRFARVRFAPQQSVFLSSTFEF